MNLFKRFTNKETSQIMAGPLALLIGGVLMGLAPVNAWPLAWIALVPLWTLSCQPPCQPQPPQTIAWRRTLCYAAIWGAAYHGIALSWVRGLHPMMWMGVPWLGSIAVALFAWAFITLWGVGIGVIWTGLMVALGKWTAENGKPLTGLSRVLVGTALWCALEWIWSVGPLYWSPVNYTQSPYNLLALQLGQLSGPLTISAAIVAVNGLLAEAWISGTSRQWNATVRGSRSRMPPALLYAIALFAAVHLLGFALYSRPLTNSPNQALTVGLIQGNVPTNQKLTGRGIKASRQIYLEGYEALAAEGADLIITPEGAIPQEWNAFLQDQNLFLRAVVKTGVPLLLGTFAHQQIDNPQTPLTQSLLMLAPNGEGSNSEIIGRYNKIKLVPLGEYIPFEPVIGAIINRLSPFGESMVAGRFDQQIQTPFGPIVAGICYESVYPNLFRAQTKAGGQAIVTASNNDPYPPRQMMQHHAQDVMRAVETDRWTVRVTNTGISGVVDPRGRSQWLSTPNEYETHLAKIYLRQTQAAYVRWGNWLTPLLLLGGAIAIFSRRHML